MIPCIYTFRFDGEKREKALRRFECSIENVLQQTDEIFILNASQEKLYIKFVGLDIKIIDKSQTGIFNKSKLLNHLIRFYLQDYEYCIMSDVDILFQPGYFKKMEEYSKSAEPVRCIGYNQSQFEEYYTSDFNDALDEIKARGVMSWRCGESPGTGLLHIPSFMKIQGYNEDFQEYGPEDQELNRRIKYKNKFIYDKDLVNIHLFHEPNAMNFVNINNEIYNESEKQFLAGNLIRNTETWGEY